jgi:outer membrane protein OmpA-like peptidoglycan-associated protein
MQVITAGKRGELMAQLTSTTPDLMGIVSRQITPDVIRSVAFQLSEDRTTTASALSAAVPSALTALSDVASSDTGARHLKNVIDEKRRSGGPEIDEDRSLFPTARSLPGDHAASLIDEELGTTKSTSIAAAVASATGVKPASAQKIMGGVATAAVAALAKSSGGLGAGALQSMFREQRGQWVSKLPGPVASLFNGHSGAAPVVVPPPTARAYDERMVTGPAIRELEAPRRNWMIPLILVALALLAIPVLRGLRRPKAPALPPQPQTMEPARPAPPAPQPPAATAPSPETPAPAATPPAATAPAPETPAPETRLQPAPVAAEPGSTQDLAQFLAGTGETTPHAFAPTPLNFAFGSARPTAESQATLDDIAAALNAHPKATIRVESHTDAVGSPEANLNLSQARADAIKNELVDRGVDGGRIETAGMGQDLPIATNDTAEGRAANRRSEIVVTGR